MSHSMLSSDDSIGVVNTSIFANPTFVTVMISERKRCVIRMLRGHSSSEESNATTAAAAVASTNVVCGDGFVA